MTRRNLRICVAGGNALATAVVEALGKLSGIEIVRQISTVGMVPAGTDVLVEMVGGVEPAFRSAMAALGSGVSCVVTSPMLVAAHGRVLAGAAEGMHCALGMSGAAMGVDFEKLVVGADVRRVTALWSDGASALLARMGFRNESFERLHSDFIKHDLDLSDASGKLTQARTAALMGACGGWPRVSAQVRVGVDALDPTDIRKLREFGLGLVYGSVLERGRFYTGPLAVALDGSLMRDRGRDVLVVEEEGGAQQVWSRDGDEWGRVVRGVTADVRAMVREKGGGKIEENGLISYSYLDDIEDVCYVRVGAGRREAILANVDHVLEERMDGEGMWHAVVRGMAIGQLRLLSSEGLALPVAGEWTPAAAAGLRLVG